MLYKDVIKLVAITRTKNNMGDLIETPSYRTVFANKKSIRQDEFYQAAATGFKPEIKFEIRSIEYQGEDRLSCNGREYNIIRTFDRGENIELICGGLVNKT